MLSDTYDVPAYKFGLLIPCEEIPYDDDESYVAEYNSLLGRNGAYLVPFENFDGLTVDELLRTIRRKGVCLACYSEYDNFSTEQKDFTVHYRVFFTPNYLKALGGRRFDRLVESHFEEKIKDVNTGLKRKKQPNVIFKDTYMAVLKKLMKKLCNLEFLETQNNVLDNM